MATLSQGAGYAILALGHIATSTEQPILVRDIAEACELPAAFLSKLINRLARAGVVKTQRGVNGGVGLSRPAEEITLYQVCEAIGDPVLEQRCMLGIDECSDDRACPAHTFNVAQRKQVIQFLSMTTIRDIANFESARLLKQAGRPTTVDPGSDAAPPSTG